MSKKIENDENLNQIESVENTVGVKKQKSVKAIIKRVLFAIGISLLGIIIVLVGWMCVDKYVLGSPAPRLFGKSGFIVLTGSMSGTIEEGDIVITEKTDDYKIGDIITYLPEGYTTPVTHRIIGYTQDGGYTTKGDANNTKDSEPVYKEQILGEVVNVLPKVGLFFTWLKTEYGWIYLAGCIVVVAGGVFVYRYLVGSEQDAEKQNAIDGQVKNDEASDEAKDSPLNDGENK